MGVEDEVNEFLERYWKLPFEVNYDDMWDEGWVRHKESLRGKYGNEVIDKYDELIRTWDETPGDGYNEINDLVYETGLCDEIARATILRSRETLRTLLAKLQKEQPFTVADLGSGDGKIAIGMALYFDNLTKIYAVDISPAAIKRMQINMQSLEPRDKDKIAGKIVAMQGDYMTDDLNKKFLENEKEGTDIVLAAYPRLSLDLLLPHLPKFMKPDGKILACYPNNLGDHATCAMALIKDETNIIASEYSLNFDILAHSEYLPWETLVINAGQRVQN